MTFFKVLLLFCIFPNFCDAAGNLVTKMLPPIETVIPFIGVLLSIAFFPLLIPKLWHKNEKKILAFWVLISTWLCFISFGKVNTIHLLTYIFAREYLPFILLIGALFIISNGIHIKINREGSTKVNIIILFLGEIFSNFIGTTGTSILFLRSLLEANKNRKYKIQTVMAFIFLVSNIGGCLLPFGDPPLFLGYIKGVDFFWTATHLFPMFLIVSVALLILYGIIDQFYVKKEKFVADRNNNMYKLPIVEITGKFNVCLMFFIVILVACTGALPKKNAFEIFNVSISYKNLIRDIGLLLIVLISLFHSKYAKSEMEKQKIVWAPLTEVVTFFLAIFLTMAPVAAMLKGGHPFFAPIRNALLSSEHAAFLYFWLLSPFSAFLDNSPTYLIFFKMAGDANYLMHEGAKILMAISAGSVFMGALTYIGNAPNFMVRTIAKQYGVKMPGFLGYAAYASVILLPLFLIVSWLMLY
ncbi:MAG: sodium:proton antiporter [Holosporales bacterium]|nr:sodium:proton antiporter [Holosporales bacterium]